MSKKFCSVPWRELTFSSQNQYSVCCKWDESKSVGLVDSNNSINEHWNGKLMKDLRQKFINGDNIPECAWCWKDEKANKVSARLRRNQHYYGQADRYNNFTTHSLFAPYITKIGLYNDFNELLAIGQLAKPVKNDKELLIGIQVRFDV